MKLTIEVCPPRVISTVSVNSGEPLPSWVKGPWAITGRTADHYIRVDNYYFLWEVLRTKLNRTGEPRLTAFKGRLVPLMNCELCKFLIRDGDQERCQLGKEMMGTNPYHSGYCTYYTYGNPTYNHSFDVVITANRPQIYDHSDYIQRWPKERRAPSIHINDYSDS